MNSIDGKIEDGFKWFGLALFSSVLVGGPLGVATDNMTVFFVISALCLCAWAVFFYVKISRYCQKLKKELYEKFYKECENQGINNIHNSFQAQKAVLIAKNLKMKSKEYSDIVSFYEKVQKNILGEKQQALQKQQQIEFDALNKYSNLYGRNKRIKMLNDIRNYYNHCAEILRSAAHGMVNASQQKEIDLALHGGIVAGLAGGVAGIAVAVDNQITNAKIREQNKASLNAIAPSVLNYMDKSFSYSEKAKNIQRLIDEANLKVVFDVAYADVFEYLSFSKININISETGSAIITTTVKLNSKIDVMEQTAVVDGTVIAAIYHNGERIGNAVLVFPVFGVDSKAELKGMYIGEIPMISKQSYDIKIEPSQNLWIMEK